MNVTIKCFQLSLVLALLGLVFVADVIATDRKASWAVAKDKQAVLQPGSIHMQGELGRRMDDCMENFVTAWDWDRLIAPFRDKTDGIPTGSFPDQWRCDYWGKWFTALAWGYAHEPTDKRKTLIDQVVKKLLATAGPDGYIGTFSKETRLNGGYDVWGRQCVILGLVAHYDLTGNKASLDAACGELDCLMREVEQKKVRIPDLGWPNFNGLTPSVIIESGALLYDRTGLKKYRDFSEKIVAQWNEPGKLAPNGLRLVDDALAHKPAREIGSPKGYEQLYCFIGLCELYRATGNRNYLDAATALAKNIREEELFVTGSGTEREFWFQGRLQQTRVVDKPAETCVTAHWMYLCWQLLRLTDDPAYADEMEVSLYNALLGALMPDGQWWEYYNSLMGERAPSWIHQEDVGLTCCPVSGSRALMLTPFWAVMQTSEGPTVNLYFPGQAKLKTASGADVSLKMDTSYPREGTVRIFVEPDHPETFTLALRIPAWSQKTTLKVNDQEQPVQPGTYAKIRREWSGGDRVELALDMRASILDAPDGNGQVALKRGPLVLAFDNRLTPPEKDAVAVIRRNEGTSKIDVKPNVNAAKKAGVWMAFDVPFLVNGKNYTLTMCDYASAGNKWSAKNVFRTWFPQPLNLGTVYNTGVTRDHLTYTPTTPEAAKTPSKRPRRVIWQYHPNRILFLGNSITRCPAVPEIGWMNDWGMAASAKEKDYVHLLANSIAKLSKSDPDILFENIADFERNYETYDINTKLHEHLQFKPDIVVVAIGENVPPLDTEESRTKFKDRFSKLLQALKDTGRPAIFVRSCFWPDKTKNEVMKQTCEAMEAVFVDISSCVRDKINSTHPKRNLKDEDMRAIANALYRTITAQ